MDIKQKKFKVNYLTVLKLGISTIKDRIAQEVIRQLMNPTFDVMFHKNSFGFRSGRGCHQAPWRILEYKRKGYNKVVDIDIEGFFDNIEHDIIMAFIRTKIADESVLDIIELFLRSGIFVCYTDDLVIICKTNSETENALKFTFENSRKKFEDPLRTFTTIKHNLEDEMFEKLNMIPRGISPIAIAACNKSPGNR